MNILWHRSWDNPNSLREDWRLGPCYHFDNTFCLSLSVIESETSLCPLLSVCRFRRLDLKQYGFIDPTYYVAYNVFKLVFQLVVRLVNSFCNNFKFTCHAPIEPLAYFRFIFLLDHFQSLFKYSGVQIPWLLWWQLLYIQVKQCETKYTSR